MGGIIGYLNAANSGVDRARVCISASWRHMVSLVVIVDPRRLLALAVIAVFRKSSMNPHSKRLSDNGAGSRFFPEPIG